MMHTIYNETHQYRRGPEVHTNPHENVPRHNPYRQPQMSPRWNRSSLRGTGGRAHEYGHTHLSARVQRRTHPHKPDAHTSSCTRTGVHGSTRTHTGALMPLRVHEHVQGRACPRRARALGRAHAHVQGLKPPAARAYTHSGEFESPNLLTQCVNGLPEHYISVLFANRL